MNRLDQRQTRPLAIYRGRSGPADAPMVRAYHARSGSKSSARSLLSGSVSVPDGSFRCWNTAAATKIKTGENENAERFLSLCVSRRRFGESRSRIANPRGLRSMSSGRNARGRQAAVVLFEGGQGPSSRLDGHCRDQSRSGPRQISICSRSLIRARAIPHAAGRTPNSFGLSRRSASVYLSRTALNASSPSCRMPRSRQLRVMMH